MIDNIEREIPVASKYYPVPTRQSLSLPSPYALCFILLYLYSAALSNQSLLCLLRLLHRRDDEVEEERVGKGSSAFCWICEKKTSLHSRAVAVFTCWTPFIVITLSTISFNARDFITFLLSLSGHRASLICIQSSTCQCPRVQELRREVKKLLKAFHWLFTLSIVRPFKCFILHNQPPSRFMHRIVFSVWVFDIRHNANCRVRARSFDRRTSIQPKKRSKRVKEISTTEMDNQINTRESQSTHIHAL